MKKLLFFLLFSPALAQAATLVNPTRISSGTLPSGSTHYIQNTDTLQTGARFHVSTGNFTLAESAVGLNFNLQTSGQHDAATLFRAFQPDISDPALRLTTYNHVPAGGWTEWIWWTYRDGVEEELFGHAADGTSNITVFDDDGMFAWANGEGATGVSARIFSIRRVSDVLTIEPFGYGESVDLAKYADMNGPLAFHPFVKSQLENDTPGIAGMIANCSDCTYDGMVISTGTNPGAWVRIWDRTKHMDSVPGVSAGSYTNANITVDAQGIVTAASNGTAGGGGASTLAVSSRTAAGSVTQVSSPTVAIVGNYPILIELSGGATAEFKADASSFTLQGQSVVSFSSAASTYLYNSSASLTYIPYVTFNSSAANTYPTISTVSGNYLLKSSAAITYINTAGDSYTGVHDAGGATSLEIPNGTGPTVDATGEFAVDTSTGQFIFFDGVNAVVLPSTYSQHMTIESPAVGDYPFFFRPHNDITITRAVCISSAATSASIQIDECDSAGINCAAITTAAACTTSDINLAVTNSAVERTDRIRVKVTAVSGTPGWVAVDLYYRETRR